MTPALSLSPRQAFQSYFVCLNYSSCSVTVLVLSLFLFCFCSCSELFLFRNCSCSVIVISHCGCFQAKAKPLGRVITLPHITHFTLRCIGTSLQVEFTLQSCDDKNRCITQNNQYQYQ